MHTAESHAVDNLEFLKHQQRNAVAVAVKASQLSTPVEVVAILRILLHRNNLMRNGFHPCAGQYAQNAPT
jgi:hypothetical protein